MARPRLIVCLSARLRLSRALLILQAAAGEDREHIALAQRRLQTELDENARLRKQLEDAQAKLDAIAKIERNLTQRKSGNEGTQP